MGDPRLNTHRCFRIRTCAVAIVAVLATALLPWRGSRPSGAEKQGYLSQTYIDTVIQRAYENFSVAMLEAATQMSQESAIEQARNVVNKLKRLARDDVNSKYILWKVSELEYQIFLEERELVHQERTQNIVRLNELVDQFNAEVGRTRPDFIRLQGLVEQFAALDRAKAREIEGLIARRSSQVAKQVLAQISAALNKGDMEKVRAGLDYCYANRGVLAVTDQQVQRYNAAMGSRIKLADQRRYIEEDMHAVQKCIAVHDFHGAWRTLGLIDRRLGNVGGDLSAQQLRVYQAHRDRLIRSIAACEDSLVDVNIEVYNTQGRSAAQDYMDNVLRVRGVSREKLAVVDHAMMGAAAIERREYDPEMRKVFVDLADATQPDGNVLLDDLGERAKRRARERADSAEAARVALQMEEEKEWRRKHRREARNRQREEREKLKAEKERVRQAIERAQREELERRMEEERRKAEVALSGGRTNSGLGTRSESDANRQLAQQNIVLIYNLLEQGLVDVAYERFMLLRDLLREHLLPEAYATLEATVLAAYQDSASQ